MLYQYLYTLHHAFLETPSPAREDLEPVLNGGTVHVRDCVSPFLVDFSSALWQQTTKTDFCLSAGSILRFHFLLTGTFFFFFFFFARERLRKTSLSRNAAETLNHFESSCCCCRCFCLFVFYKCIIILAVMNFRGNTCDLHFVWCLKMELRGVIVTALCVIV